MGPVRRGDVCHLTIPNTPPALSSTASGAVEAAWRGFMPLMGQEAEMNAGEGGKRKEGLELALWWEGKQKGWT